MNKKIKPPFIPQLEDETDIKYFEKSLAESPVLSENLELVIGEEENEDEDQYEGFTFVATSYKDLKNVEKDD